MQGATQNCACPTLRGDMGSMHNCTKSTDNMTFVLCIWSAGSKDHGGLELAIQ